MNGFVNVMCFDYNRIFRGPGRFSRGPENHHNFHKGYYASISRNGVGRLFYRLMKKVKS